MPVSIMEIGNKIGDENFINKCVEKKKNKKVNHLKLNECEQILQKLQNQKDSHYYQHVLQRYRNLMPAHQDAFILSKIGPVSSATFASSYEHNL